MDDRIHFLEHRGKQILLADGLVLGELARREPAPVLAGGTL